MVNSLDYTATIYLYSSCTRWGICDDAQIHDSSDRHFVYSLKSQTRNSELCDKSELDCLMNIPPHTGAFRRSYSGLFDWRGNRSRIFRLTNMVYATSSPKIWRLEKTRLQALSTFSARPCGIIVQKVYRRFLLQIDKSITFKNPRCQPPDISETCFVHEVRCRGLPRPRYDAIGCSSVIYSWFSSQIYFLFYVIEFLVEILSLL